MLLLLAIGTTMLTPGTAFLLLCAEARTCRACGELANRLDAVQPSSLATCDDC